jgi:branched-chain amino acid transport system ATP-binding protein
MTDTLLSLRGLRKSFGATEIIRGVDFEIHANERHAVIGPNGAGKSTLFHLISGNLTPTAGEIYFNQQEIGGLPPQAINHLGLSRSFQITNIFPKLTVFENLRLAAMRPHNVQYTFWRFIENNRKIREQTERLLELVRLQSRASTIAGEMSYSEQRSLEIAMTLASDPQLILLDEPMAGMSQEETNYTSELIKDVTKGCALVIVEHDMDVVFSLSDRISVLVYGQMIATGTPDEIRNNSTVKEAYLGEETMS